MCTAATYQTRDFYMGRTLDYEFSYGDQITVTPRNYPFSFLHMPSLSHHYAMIGMACVMDDYPLYYEAFNEKGLGIAGLNFVGNAVYFDPKPEKDNIAQFELIPWILGTCASLAEAKESLSRINLISTPFKRIFRSHSFTGSSQMHRVPSPWNPRRTVCMSTTIRSAF